MRFLEERGDRRVTGIEKLWRQVDGGSSPNVVVPRPMLRDIARQIESESERAPRRCVVPEVGEFAADVCLAFGAAMAALVSCYVLVSVVTIAGWAGAAALGALSAVLIAIGIRSRGR